MCLMEKKSMLDKLHSSVSYSVVDCEFNVKQSTMYIKQDALKQNKTHTHTHTHTQNKTWNYEVKYDWGWNLPFRGMKKKYEAWLLTTDFSVY